MIKRLIFIFILMFSLEACASQTTTNYELVIPTERSREWMGIISRDIISTDKIMGILSADVQTISQTVVILSNDLANISVAGNDTEVQFNDNDSFGAESGLTFDATNNVLSTGTLSSDLISTDKINAIGDLAINQSALGNVELFQDLSIAAASSGKTFKVIKNEDGSEKSINIRVREFGIGKIESIGGPLEVNSPSGQTASFSSGFNANVMITTGGGTGKILAQQVLSVDKSLIISAESSTTGLAVTDQVGRIEIVSSDGVTKCYIPIYLGG